MKLSEIKLWKLNAFDLLLILVIIIFVGAIGITHITSNNSDVVQAGNSNLGTKFTYTISINNLAETSADMLKVGDDVYERVSNTYIGKISKLDIREAKGNLETASGDIILATLPERIDVDITIETDGTIRNNEYLANGLIRIMVGNLKEIKTKYVMCSGTVSSIDREEVK